MGPSTIYEVKLVYTVRAFRCITRVHCHYKREAHT
jgi:hypothetical protein